MRQKLSAWNTMYSTHPLLEASLPGSFPLQDGGPRKQRLHRISSPCLDPAIILLLQVGIFVSQTQLVWELSQEVETWGEEWMPLREEN